VAPLTLVRPHGTGTTRAGRSDPVLWGALGLLALFLLTQYGDVRSVPFINDDYMFLDKTRDAAFGSLWEPKALAFHWYRPWSRELHYWTLQKLFGAREAPFHVASLALALAALGGFAALVRRLAGPRVALIAVAGWASLAAWAVPLIWVAGVQDLWMLVFAFLCIGAASAGWKWAGAAALLLALLSKESAVVLPAIAVAFEMLVSRRSLKEALRRTAPLWIVTVAWAFFHPLLGGRLWHPLLDAVPPAPRPPLAQVLARTFLLPLNLDAWPAPGSGWGSVLVRGVVGAALLAGLVVLAQRVGRRRSAGAPPPSGIGRFGVAWALIGWLPILMPGLGWHNYYALLGAAGAWLAAAVALARVPAAAIGLVALLALLRAGRAETPSLDWGSESYQRRAASFIEYMRSDLQRRHPTLPFHSRLYFVRVPSNVGFLTGDGPALRVWYGDPTLRAGYYPSYRLRAALEPGGQDFFFRFDSTQGWVEVVRGRENVKEARRLDPRWALDHEMLAQTLARGGDWRTAAAEYQKLADAESLRVEFAYNAAVCHETLGDSARAAVWYARAAALPGADAEARAAARHYARHLPGAGRR
jgi:hypothetical protein